MCRSIEKREKKNGICFSFSPLVVVVIAIDFVIVIFCFLSFLPSLQNNRSLFAKSTSLCFAAPFKGPTIAYTISLVRHQFFIHSLHIITAVNLVFHLLFDCLSSLRIVSYFSSSSSFSFRFNYIFFESRLHFKSLFSSSLSCSCCCFFREKNRIHHMRTNGQTACFVLPFFFEPLSSKFNTTWLPYVLSLYRCCVSEWNESANERMPLIQTRQTEFQLMGKPQYRITVIKENQIRNNAYKLIK